MTDGTQPEPLILSNETLGTHFAESYRVLRANINFSSIDRPVKTILVTSAQPREGKTMTVINLGIIMSQTGLRVLIVDADFRQPSLYSAFGFEANGHRRPRGLSDMIVGTAGLRDVVRASGFDRVAVVPAGTAPPNPNELLGSLRMRAVLDEIGRQSDVVLIDSPPCLLYADAIVLSAMTDGVLYVVRSGSQDKIAQRRVHRQLQQAKARVLGAVFNAVEVDTGATYRYDYPQRDR